MLEIHLGDVCHWCTSWTSPIVWTSWWYEVFYVIYVLHQLLFKIGVTIGFFVLHQKLPCLVVRQKMPHHGQNTLALGQNKKVMSTYSVSRIDQRILTKGWRQIMTIRPFLEIGDKVMFMLYHGTKGTFMFIDDIPWSSWFQIVVVVGTIFLKCWVLSIVG